MDIARCWGVMPPWARALGRTCGCVSRSVGPVLTSRRFLYACVGSRNAGAIFRLRTGADRAKEHSPDQPRRTERTRGRGPRRGCDVGGKGSSDPRPGGRSVAAGPAGGQRGLAAADSRGGEEAMSPLIPNGWIPLGPSCVINGQVGYEHDGTAPVAGRATAIALHPDHPDTHVFVRTTLGGVWRSTDGGLN